MRYHDQVDGEGVGIASGVALVELAATKPTAFKQIGSELTRRSADPTAADALIDAYRSGRMPPWLAAYLLGCVRAPRGYAVAREVLLAAPGHLAESYAAAAMARIAGADAHDDLVDLMMAARRLRSREGAAHGLGDLGRAGTAALMLRAVQADRVRPRTAGVIVARLPDAVPLLLQWLGTDDDLIEQMAVHAAASLLASSAGSPDLTLARAIRRTLDAGRVKLAPRTREVLLERISQALTTQTD